MITAIFSFPHHVSRQVILRTSCIGTGSPVTLEMPKPHHASRQVEWRSIRIQTGNPVATAIAVSRPLVQEQLRFARSQAGNPVTAQIVFPYPLVNADIRTAHAVSGSPVTALIGFSNPLKYAALCSANNRAGSPVTERIAFYRLPTLYAALRWSSCRKNYETAMVRFRNDYHNLETNSICYCYDWKTTYGTALRYRHWSVVPAGWRIVAKNIENGESFDLGFIDANTEIPALEDVFLPDGEYEISVLTSSLFWKDCRDNQIRQLSLRLDGRSPLSTIYNLRSAVLDGITTTYWSANQSELDDCVFGVWYSSEPPVAVNRPPDQTVLYFSSQTEYATTFNQNAPAWVAVAAMRTENEAETGKVHELYLDWSNVPPRRPDDVMVLMLPAFDAKVENRHEDDPFMTLWNG